MHTINFSSLLCRKSFYAIHFSKHGPMKLSHSKSPFERFSRIGSRWCHVCQPIEPASTPVQAPAQPTFAQQLSSLIENSSLPFLSDPNNPVWIRPCRLENHLRDWMEMRSFVLSDRCGHFRKQGWTLPCEICNVHDENHARREKLFECMYDTKRLSGP